MLAGQHGASMSQKMLQPQKGGIQIQITSESGRHSAQWNKAGTRGQGSHEATDGDTYKVTETGSNSTPDCQGLGGWRMGKCFLGTEFPFGMIQ